MNFVVETHHLPPAQSGSVPNERKRKWLEDLQSQSKEMNE